MRYVWGAVTITGIVLVWWWMLNMRKEEDKEEDLRQARDRVAWLQALGRIWRRHNDSDR